METRNRQTVTRGEGDKGGKKGKGLVKEQVRMTHGHGQQGGDWLWVREVGWAEYSKGGKLGQLSQKNNKCFLKGFYLFIFLERGEGRRKERERNIHHLPLTCGNW